jgi:hypothetical protein
MVRGSCMCAEIDSSHIQNVETKLYVHNYVYKCSTVLHGRETRTPTATLMFDISSRNQQCSDWRRKTQVVPSKDFLCTVQHWVENATFKTDLFCQQFWRICMLQSKFTKITISSYSWQGHEFPFYLLLDKPDTRIPEPKVVRVHGFVDILETCGMHWRLFLFCFVLFCFFLTDTCTQRQATVPFLY